MKWFTDDALHKKYYPDNALYKHYQEDIWSIPTHNDESIFEQYTIGIFAAGLNWNTSFLRYPELTKAFHDWNFKKIAQMPNHEVDKMMENKNLIRNKRKMEATISNAQLVLDLQKKYGSLDNYFWNLVDYKQERIEATTVAGLGTTSEVGNRIARQMKKDGFKYAGPVSVYSFLISIGIISARIDKKGIEKNPKENIVLASEQGENVFNV